MAVPIKLETTTIDAACRLLSLKRGSKALTAPPISSISTDVSADGQRFLVNDLEESVPAPPITVVVNWQEELKQK